MPTVQQPFQEDLTGESVENLIEDNIHCCPLIYQASHFVIEGYQVDLE